MAMESSSKVEENVNVNVDVEGYQSNNINKARLQSTLAALVDDPILSDVPKKPTLSDVDTLINLELGSAMRISVLKLDGSSLGKSHNSPISSFAFLRTPNLHVIAGVILFYSFMWW